MDETNPREELYNQFKASLKEPVSERYFPEDELVEIFDYAGDVADDYAQFEVLFCAARLYPDSQQLLDRKALFYLDTTESDENPESPTAIAFVADNPDMSSPLMDITRLQVNHPEKPVEALNFFLEQYDTLGDEEIIRLIDLACDLGQYDWVIQNLDTLRRKTPYAPTLLYELMNRATEAEDFRTVVKVTEELIESEPFASGYWATQFRAYAKLGMEAEARSSFEYAKDLATGDEDTISFLADVILECAPFLTDEGLEMVNDFLATHPDNYRIFTARGAMMINKERYAELEKDLVEHVAKYGVNAQSLRHLFLIAHEGAGKLFADELKRGNGVFQPGEIDELVDNLHMNSNHVGMNELMTALDSVMDDTMSLPLAHYWIEALYNLGDYSKVLKIFMQYKPDDVLSFLSFPPRGTAFWLIVLLSMIRLNQAPFLFFDIQKLRRAVIEGMEHGPMPVKMTYIPVLELIDKLMEHPVSDREYWIKQRFF